MSPLDYHLRGWRIVPIPAGQKQPAMQGWPDFRPAAEDLPRLFNGKNIGLIVGVRSGSVVDIDLDCAEAIALADLYLPPTGAEFGRLTKPRSHRLYVAPGATFEAFADPLLDGKNTLLELRADGRTGGAHLTMLPPSITGGEQREWHSDVIAPAAVDARALRLTVGRLAIGCLVMQYLSEHAAHRPGPDLPRVLWEFDSPVSAGLPERATACMPRRWPTSTAA